MDRISEEIFRLSREHISQAIRLRRGRYLNANNIELYIEEVAEDIIFRIEAYFASYNHEKTIEKESIKFPKNLWEHIKQEFAPKWFLKRYPVKVNEYSRKTVIEVKKICPHIGLDPERDHLDFLVCSPEWDQILANSKMKPEYDKERK